MNAAVNLRPMMAGRLLEYFRAMIDTAAFGIVSAEVDATKTGK